MNAYYWFILNCLLIAGAFFSTKYARHTLKAMGDPASSGPAKVEKAHRKASKPAPKKSQDGGARPVTPPPGLQSLDALWEASLFKPGRTENQTDESGKPGEGTQRAKEEQANSQFELVGLLRVKNDSLSPVAIIKQKVQSSRRYVNRGYRQRNSPVEPEKNKPLKRIFRIGDSINESGYVLTDINLLNNSLTLTRGTETLELKIQLGDNSSNERKKQATVQAEILRKKREAVAATSKASLQDKKSGTPPPPPKRGQIAQPTPLNPHKMSPQQIRQAIIERQKLLLQRSRKK